MNSSNAVKTSTDFSTQRWSREAVEQTRTFTVQESAKRSDKEARFVSRSTDKAVADISRTFEKK